MPVFVQPSLPDPRQTRSAQADEATRKARELETELRDLHALLEKFKKKQQEKSAGGTTSAEEPDGELVELADEIDRKAAAVRAIDPFRLPPFDFPTSAFPKDLLDAAVAAANAFNKQIDDAMSHKNPDGTFALPPIPTNKEEAGRILIGLEKLRADAWSELVQLSEPSSTSVPGTQNVMSPMEREAKVAELKDRIGRLTGIRNYVHDSAAYSR